MVGIKWLILVVVFAVTLQQLLVVEGSAYIDSEIEKKEPDDEEIAREIVERLATMSDTELPSDEEISLERRALQKRGWWRRTVRRVGRWVGRAALNAAVRYAISRGKK